MADFNIGEILGSLSPQDIENIKSIASDLFTGGENKDTDPPKEAPKKDAPKKEKSFAEMPDLSALGMPDLSQLSALLPVFQALNSHDDRLDFIEALKPLLSEEKRQTADEAMKLVRLFSLLPLLRERGIM